MVGDVATAYGATGKLHVSPGYDALINDNNVVAIMQEVFQKALGTDKVLLKEHPSMGAEDFSFFLNAAPGAFYNLGCGNRERGITASVHAKDFDIDEDCLSLGVFLDISLINRLLSL